MEEEEKVKIKRVAAEARKTFLAIRQLRKTMPQHTRVEKDALEKKIKELQDGWWEEVKPDFTFPKKKIKGEE
jgi:hypothetical protein